MPSLGRSWQNPAVGMMLTVVAMVTHTFIAVDALIRGHQPYGSWLVWAAAGLGVVVLSWLGKLAERRYAAALAATVTAPASGAVLGHRWLDPSHKGPHVVFLRSGKRHIQLRVIPICRPDGDLWMLYGPPGMIAPDDGEILILSDHEPAALLVQTDEVVHNGKIVTIFTEPPSADHTPN